MENGQVKGYKYSQTVASMRENLRTTSIMEKVFTNARMARDMKVIT